MEAVMGAHGRMGGGHLGTLRHTEVPKRGVPYLREMLRHCKSCSVACKARVKQVKQDLS